MSKTASPSKTNKPASKTNVRPLGDKILVRRDEAASKTESGIIIPEAGKERPKTGVVEAVGSGALDKTTGERVPLSVKKGDRILFTSYAGTELKLDGDELLIMTEDDILAVID
ncbi:MAG TPA: co-chaperone GroES [Phycisphaerales bacterium]|nr:co-chaperone GroES [Phycisphaerales bacterium]